MARQQRSAEEIRAEVRRLIHCAEEVIEDEATVNVPEPTPRIPQDGEANWTMEIFGNARGYEEICARARAGVQERWDLRA